MDVDLSADQLLEQFASDAVSIVGAEYVTAPKSLEGAATILRTASAHHLGTLIHGAGTHQQIGYPVDPDLVVSTSNLDDVIDYQPEDLTVVVGAGMTLGRLDELLAERGQSAVFPEHAPTATVGGVIAAGLSGWQRLRYGPIRDRVLEVQLVTGDGRIVTGGGRVVKNVTGYDLPRLATGSLGSLGLIGAVCLKLWPKPLHSGTITVGDAAAARSVAYRPLAIIETNDSHRVYVSGTEAEIAGQAADLGGSIDQGLAWPEPLATPLVVALRIPPGMMTDAVGRIRRIGSGVTFQAAHGVGEVRIGFEDPDVGALTDLRAWAESTGGALVVMDAPDGFASTFDPWGTPPATTELQRRIKLAFDPAGVVNSGRLPGRV